MDWHYWNWSSTRTRSLMSWPYGTSSRRSKWYSTESRKSNCSSQCRQSSMAFCYDPTYLWAQGCRANPGITLLHDVPNPYNFLTPFECTPPSFTSLGISTRLAITNDLLGQSDPPFSWDEIVIWLPQNREALFIYYISQIVPRDFAPGLD